MVKPWPSLNAQSSLRNARSMDQIKYLNGSEPCYTCQDGNSELGPFIKKVIHVDLFYDRNLCMIDMNTLTSDRI